MGNVKTVRIINFAWNRRYPQC